jgi:hypothetical protein
MQIPVPEVGSILTAVLTCFIVLAVRWLGIFGVVQLLERDQKLAVMATMNLSEVSEFGLVLCSMGKGYGHVEGDTFTIMVWTFSILAVSASYFIKYNHSAYVRLHSVFSKCSKGSQEMLGDDEHDGHEHHNRDIVLLGFGRIANALLAEVEDRCPALLSRMHIIDSNMKYKDRIERKGATFHYADIGSQDVLEHAMPHGEQHIKLVLITQPDAQLGKHTNSKIMSIVRGLPPCREAKVICTAEHTSEVDRLYSQGANYVLKMVKLSAERLGDMLEKYATGIGSKEFEKNNELAELLQQQYQGDEARKRRVSEIAKDEQKMPKKVVG